MTGHSSSYSDFMDESLYTHLIQQPLGFCYLLVLQNIQKYPKAPSQPVFIGSLSNPLLPLVGQKLSGLAPFLEGNKKELVPTLGSCGEQASTPSLETDACYGSLPHSGIYCCVPLPWKVERDCGEARLWEGVSFALAGSRQNPLHPESVARIQGKCQTVGGVGVGRKSLISDPPLLLLIH